MKLTMIRRRNSGLAERKGVRLGSEGGSISEVINTGSDLQAMTYVDLFACTSGTFGGFR